MGKFKTDVDLLEKNGRTFSRRTEYYENGQIFRVGIYSSNHGNWSWNNPAGKVITYYENGTVQSEVNHNENGSLDGESVFYAKDGQVVRRLVYSKDKLISEDNFEPKPIVVLG